MAARPSAHAWERPGEAAAFSLGSIFLPQGPRLPERELDRPPSLSGQECALAPRTTVPANPSPTQKRREGAHSVAPSAPRGWPGGWTQAESPSSGPLGLPGKTLEPLSLILSPAATRLAASGEGSLPSRWKRMTQQVLACQARRHRCFPRPVHGAASRPAQSKTSGGGSPGRRAPEACTPAPLRIEGGAPLSQTRRASPTLAPPTGALGQQCELGASKAQTPEQEGAGARASPHLDPAGGPTRLRVLASDTTVPPRGGASEDAASARLPSGSVGAAQ